MFKLGPPATVLSLFGALLLSCPSFAQGFTYPAGFRTERIPTNGTTLHVRIGGKGPAVVLLHGYGETGDMWAPLAADLARDHTVVAPDLRGMGLSARAERGFEKKNQAADIAGVMDALKMPSAAVVAHDIGNMVAFSLAAQHPQRVTRLVLMDAPVPGVGPWEEILKNPLLWHFRFGGPDMERLVAGRERIYLDRFWNEFSADPKRFGEASRRHYARLYARPGAMRAGFLQFAAFDQDADRQPRFPLGGRPLEHADACGWRRALLRRHHGGGDARRRRRRARGRHPELRALAHGRAADGNDRRDPHIPRLEEMSGPQPIIMGGKPMPMRSKWTLWALVGALAVGLLWSAPGVLAQPAAPSSVLPTGGGQALIDTSDSVLLLLDHQVRPVPDREGHQRRRAAQQHRHAGEAGDTSENSRHHHGVRAQRPERPAHARDPSVRAARGLCRRARAR